MLRDVLESDLEAFFSHQSEPEGARMAAMRPRARDAFLAHWRDNILGVPENIKKTIVVSGEIVGNIGSYSINGQRLVGYWIGMAYAGRGIASAALAELIAHYETVRPLYAHVAASNPASVRVLEKCGFVRVGETVVGDDGIEELEMRLDAPPNARGHDDG